MRPHPQRKHGNPSRNPAPDHPKRVDSRSAHILGTYRGGAIADVSDYESFAYSFDMGVLLLLQDCPCSSYVSGAFKRLRNNVLDARDIMGFIDACVLIRTKVVTLGRFHTTLFKELRHRWVGGLCAAIAAAIGSPVEHPSREFDKLATFLGWLKRLPVCIRPEQEAIDAYFTCDRRISQVEPCDSEFFPLVLEIWREAFDGFVLQPPFKGRHGSGSTADCGRSLGRKWESLHIDHVADACMRYPNLEKVLDNLPVTTDSNRTSKVVFVPKQAGKMRTICMEPAWLQYLQQGIAAQLRSHCERPGHPFHSIVAIRSQDQNRSLCAWAYSDRLATIDLSDASDSVSNSMVTALCKGLPLARYLLASRSTFTDVCGYTASMAKYAPMGSALCFPIECYVFASIVEAAFRKRYGHASAGHRSGVSVYGDDIIIPRELYQLVVSALHSFGFIVNEEKSYKDPPFYESCGVEYCYGVKISTIRHPRAHLASSGLCTPDRVGMVTDLSNELYKHGYFDARRYLLKSCMEDIVVVNESTRARFGDILRFNDKELIPLVEDYTQHQWYKPWHRSVVSGKRVQIRVDRGPNDFQQWRSQVNDRTRSERIGSLYRYFKPIEIDPIFSTKAVLYLTKFGLTELLEGKDVEAHGSSSTGDLHTLLRRYVS